MGKPKSADARYGLVLDHPGAPPVVHRVGDIGDFGPEPTPLELIDLDLEAAQALDADEGCPLKLVELTKAQTVALEKELAAANPAPADDAEQAADGDPGEGVTNG